MKKINTPINVKDIQDLTVGDEVLLNGIIYTARDQAHKRLVEMISKGQKLPVDLEGEVIYFCGPTNTPKGKVIGSCGPTTSKRMDEFSPVLLKGGLKGMIGKGERSCVVVESIKKNKGIYFLAYAGCGAFINQFIKKSKVVAFADLGPEAIRELTIKDLPLIVAVDINGNNIFKSRGNDGK